MLGTDIAPQHIPATDNLIDQLRVMWFNGSAIRGIIYMFARFPFGIVAFILAVMAVSLPFGLIIAPLTYQSSNIVIGGNTVDTLPEAIIAAVIGLILSPFFMMGVNALAGFWKLFATALLHGKRTVEIDMEKAKRETFDYEKLKRDDGIHLAEPVSKAKNDDPSRRSISDLVHRTMEAQSQDDDQAAQQ